MDTFSKRYSKLNSAQKRAVDNIDGPVFVIAGPGTGKTELLALRVANILQKDSTMLPSNILCLTFTDSAAQNMRTRLIDLIGQDAYQVAIHTFNSFGSYVMSLYPEYFYEWRDVKTADELVVHRLLESILRNLPGDHVLAGRSLEGDFFAIRQLKNFIQDAKKANISPSRLVEIVRQNETDTNNVLPLIRQYWPVDRMSAKNTLSIHSLVDSLTTLDRNEDTISDGVQSLQNILVDSLEYAKDSSDASDKANDTRPFTAWKNNWLEKDADGQWILKASKHVEKLYEAIKIYDLYQKALASEHLADFNDQVLWVLSSMKKHKELRINLQEKFQYLMIDEYQDTNRSQLDLAKYLTDQEIHEGRPNIMVVGDDDQAIYKFQGADISNIHEFETAYKEPLFVTLSENYRSNESIINGSKNISAQIALSLSRIKSINKNLSINIKNSGVGAQILSFSSQQAHYSWVASEIKKAVNSGKKGSAVAILARERSQLDAIVPFLRSIQIPINYERSENVLDQEHIVTLLTLARFVHLLGQEKLMEANALIAEVLSHPMWQIPPFDLWMLSRDSYKDKTLWLDKIAELPSQNRVKVVCEFLLRLAYLSSNIALEQVIDLLVGEQESLVENEELSESMTLSPFKNYYFKQDLFDKKPEQYLQFLSHLSTLRRKLRSYQNSKTDTLTLGDLLEFIDSYKRAGLVMLDSAPHRESLDAVTLMTCHKAKGLEYESVFIIGVNETNWSKRGSNNSRFSYPENLREIAPPSGDEDDALRLLFVAMTRAKQNLYICHYSKDEDGKTLQLFSPLTESDIKRIDNTALEYNPNSLVKQYQENWIYHHGSVDITDKKALLSEALEKYSLSATHLNNFLDVCSGGPLYFLTQNLLSFPSAMSPHAQYGTAVHHTIKRAHEEVIMGEKPSVKALVEYFSKDLKAMALDATRMQEFLTRGSKALTAFFDEKLPTFTVNDLPEVDFAYRGVHISDAKIKGSLDLVSIDKDQKTVIVTDYKTGKSLPKWETSLSTPEHDKIKLHKYRQQLLFYKLLIDGSAEYGSKGYHAETALLSFVEPDTYGKIKQLSIIYEDEELERTKNLIKIVWQKIMNLDFPSTDAYDQTVEGIISFEQDLLGGKI